MLMAVLRSNVAVRLTADENSSKVSTRNDKRLLPPFHLIVLLNAR
jgi:hypothetical protein